MNNIFFMMWLSDIANSIGIPLGLVALCGVAGGIYVKIGITRYPDKESPERDKSILRCAALAFMVGVISAAILIVIPSQNTMRMYIAAQASQEILKTPTGSKAVSVLDAVLDKITKEASK